MHRFVFVALASISALAGCQNRTANGSGGSGALGKERSDCRPDKTCDPGLLCLSNLCVRPPPADCSAVAEDMASLELGNYAAPEERAPVVAKLKEQCEKVYVTKEQGQCLDKVKDKWAAAQCVPDLFPELASSKNGDCGLMADKMRTSMERQNGGYYVNNPQMKKWLDIAMRVYRQSCDEDKWPDTLKKCTLQADMTQGANPQYPVASCNQLMPPELQQKMQERMQTAMQELNR